MFGSRTARLCQTPLGNTDLSHFPSCAQNVTAVAFTCWEHPVRLKRWEVVESELYPGGEEVSAAWRQTELVWVIFHSKTFESWILEQAFGTRFNVSS